MSTTSCFIEPLDVLFLRGNKLFGDPGSYGESLVPPWPSVAAGAIRSRMLADERIDLAAFSAGKVNHATLGTPTAPGSFTVIAFHLARRFDDGRVEVLISPPADLVISERDGQVSVCRVQPTVLADGLLASSSLPCMPVLADDQRGKPAVGYWLAQCGWEKYLAGQAPETTDLIKASTLWGIDHRVGVGLDAAQRRAADGKLFSMQAVSMKKAEHGDRFDVGFVATVSGSDLPRSGLLRLGGDGRAAALHPTSISLPTVDYDAITQSRRCRLVLTTPGIFSSVDVSGAGEGAGGQEGWLPTGITRQTNGDLHFSLHGVQGRLVCAVVPRYKTVSGWDIAANNGRGTPKPAQRVAPTGSVYWLDEVDATPEALRKLVAQGLWSEPCEDAARRVEGFNRIAIAAY